MLFGRFTGFAFNSWMEGEWTMKTLPFVATYSLSTGILVVASFWQFRTSHAMLLIVNSWSASVLRGEESCIHSKHETQRQFWQNLWGLKLCIIHMKVLKWTLESWLQRWLSSIFTSCWSSMPLTATTTAGPAICKITATGAAADSDISRYC